MLLLLGTEVEGTYKPTQQQPMKQNIDMELVGSEIARDWSYLHPVRYVPVWQRILEGIAFIVIIVAFLKVLLWLVSIGAF